MVSINALDKVSLPEHLYQEAKEIGSRLLKRLEEEWPEEKKMDILFPDPEYNSYMTVKEQSHLLVHCYYNELPEDDPDLVAYRNVHKRAEEERQAAIRKAKNKRAHERAKFRRQCKAAGNYKPPAVPLPGLPQNN